MFLHQHPSSLLVQSIEKKTTINKKNLFFLAYCFIFLKKIKNTSMPRPEKAFVDNKPHNAPIGVVTANKAINRIYKPEDARVMNTNKKKQHSYLPRLTRLLINDMPNAAAAVPLCATIAMNVTTIATNNECDQCEREKFNLKYKTKPDFSSVNPNAKPAMNACNAFFKK